MTPLGSRMLYVIWKKAVNSKIKSALMRGGQG